MANNLRDLETIEVLSPVARKRRRQRLLLALFAALVTALGTAVVAGTIALGLSTDFRQQLATLRPGSRVLAITSTPQGAEVFIDDTLIGATPLRTRVAPGPHEFRLVRPGFKAWRKDLDPHPSPTLDARLEPLELATLIVESEPDGAQVLLNDEHRGNTPITLQHIPAGHYTVTITRTGYLPAAQQVELDAGETQRLTVPLKPNAERYYVEAIEAAPNQLANYTELLHVYLLKPDAAKARETTAKALAILEKAESTPTERRQLLDELSKVLNGQAGTLDPPLKAQILDGIGFLLEQAILASPDSPITYRPMVAVLGRHGQFAHIQALCEKLAANPKIGPQVHVALAQMYLDWDEPKCAILLLQSAAKTSPNSFYVRNTLASAYHRADRFDEALTEYTAAEKLLTADVTPYHQGLLHVGIARVLAARDDVPGAVARYQKALALDVSPTYSCLWRLFYAQLLAQTGRTAEAIEQYRTVENTATTYSVRERARAARLQLAAAAKAPPKPPAPEPAPKPAPEPPAKTKTPASKK